MEMQLAKDKLLLGYFIKHKDLKNAKIVKERITTIQEEMAEWVKK